MPRPRTTARDLLRAALEGKSAARKLGRIARAATPGVAGPGEIIDSLGRRWSSAKHPRDSMGRFIETGGTARVYGIGTAKVIKVAGRQHITVRDKDGVDHDVPASRVTMLKRPDGSNPLGAKRDDRLKVIEEDVRRENDPNRGDGESTPDLGDADGDGIPDDEDDDTDDGPTEQSYLARKKALEEDLAEADNDLEQAKLDKDAEGAQQARENIREAREALAEHARERTTIGAQQQSQEPPVRRQGETLKGDFAVRTSPNGRMHLVEITAVDRAGRAAKYKEVGDALEKPAAGVKLARIAQETVNGPKLREAVINRPEDGFGHPDEIRGLLAKYGTTKAPRTRAPKAPVAAPPAGPGNPRLPRPGVPAGPGVTAFDVTPERTPASKPSWSMPDADLDAELRSVESQLNGMADGDPNKAPLVRRQRAIKGEMRKRGMAQADTPDQPQDSVTNDRSRRDAAAERTARAGQPGFDANGDPEMMRGAQPQPAPEQERAGGPDGMGGRWPEVVAVMDDERLLSAKRELEEALPTADREQSSYLPTRILQLDEEIKRRGVKTDAPAAPESDSDRRNREALEAFSDEELERNARRVRGDAKQSAAVKAEQERRKAKADPAVPAAPKPTRSDRGADPMAKLAAQRREDEANAIEARRDYERVIDELVAGLPDETDDEIERFTRHSSARLAEAARTEKDRRQRAEIEQDLAEVDAPPLSQARESLDGDTTPEEKPDVQRSAVRDDRPAVLGDVPAEQGRDDRGAGDVLPEPRRAGAGAGEGGDAQRADAVDAGQPAADRSGAGSASRGGGDRAGGPGVPDAGAGDRDEAPAGAGPARVGGRGDAAGVAPKKGTRFTPTGQGDLAPTGQKAKLAANIAAIRTLLNLQAVDRPATKDEQKVLARWSGWGSLPQVFDESNSTFAKEREELKELLTDQEWRAARTNMLNAHYTDASLVDRVWDAVRALGFTGGDVLEPGSGSGNFIGRAPEGARMTGVELDPITAGISQLLYPDAEIHNESFAKSPFNDGVFDAVVGNVPFGNYPLLDKRDNKGKHSIHNHFIIKSLRKTKPGGVVAVITSQFTMDNADPKARREMAAMGDLIGAVRLPNGAHENAAGTDVVTDVLLFRKRKDGEVPGDQSWVEAHPATHPDGRPVVGISVTKDGVKQPPKQLHINDYFRDHPENVLGEIRDGGYNGMAVRKLNDHPRGLDGWMKEALDRQVAAAKADGRSWSPDAEVDGKRAKRNIGDASEGRITFDSEVEVPGKTARSKPTKRLRFKQVQDGRAVDLDVPDSQQAEVRDLLGLRDQYRLLQELEREADSDDDDALVAARTRLRRMHDDYVKTHGGPINRFTESTTKDGKTIRRRPGAIATVMDDADADLFGLDYDYNPETKTFKRADVFEKRQVNTSRKVADRTDSPRDAVALVQEQGLPLTYANIGKVLGLKPETAKTALRGIVFEDHDGSGRLVPRADYLSGNVRKKLAEARQAAESNPALADNVAELEKAKPVDAAIQDVPLQLGATWIKPQMVAQFARSLMGRHNEVEVEFDDGKWAVKTPSARSYGRNYELESATWGTADRSFYKLLEAALRQQHHFITVKKKTDDGDWYVDRKASEAATAKAEEIRDAFVDWAWSDSEVADKLTAEYNERFRSIVPRNYDDAPQRTLPGMGNVVKSLRPHQNAAVTRMVSEPAVLLEHVVGAGKTYTLVAGAMELKRLGMVNKPVLAIPGHMLGQWTREIKELYPQARVLAVDSESLAGPGARKRFAAKVKSSDWDMVVMTRESFESVPVTEEAMRAYLGRELEKLEAQKRRVLGDKTREKALQTQIEKAKAKIEEQLAKRKDEDGVTFEELGFDYVMADEAHAYKNLNYSTLMQGVASPQGAGRARDMHMKLEVLREQKKDQPNARVVTFATGTPVSNSLAEMFTMTRFLRPDLLEEADVDDFDAWAATFATVSSKPEIDTAAGGFIDKTRMRGFTDALGDALRIWRSFSDTKTAKHLNLPRPKLKGGSRQIHVVEPTEWQKKALGSFKSRVERIPPGKPQKGQDTHVAIIGDGRRAALDPRLMSERGLREAGIDKNDPTMDSPKVEAAANRIADIAAEHADRRYKVKHDDDDDAPLAELPGALQMVFIDSDAPKKDQFSAYQALKDALVARGMDPKGIRFIQEVAGSSAKKDALFDDARQGKVQVLIGSTEAMGTGTNVQNRLAALHHLDGSWKPSDIEQREGRALRQGNQHAEVEIHAYVTKGTHDQKTWDMVTYKQAALDAIANGNINMKAVEFADDVDPLTDFDTLVGAAATDPLVMDRREVESNLKKLRGAERAHRNQVANAKSKVETANKAIALSEKRVAQLEKALAQRVDTAGDAFSLSIKDESDYYGRNLRQFGGRKEAGEALGERLGLIFQDSWWPGGERAVGTVGEIAGFKIRASTVNNQGQQKKIRLDLATTDGTYDPALPLESVIVTKDDLKTGMPSVITRLENRAAGIETRIAGEKGGQQRVREEMGAAVENSRREFKKATELREAERSLALLNQLLTGKAKADDSSEDDDERNATLSEDQLENLREEYADLKAQAGRRAAEEKQRRMDELAAQVNAKDEPVAPILTEDEKQMSTAEVADDLAALGITRDLEPEGEPEPAEVVQDALPEEPAEAPEPDQVAAEVARDFDEIGVPEEAPVAEAVDTPVIGAPEEDPDATPVRGEGFYDGLPVGPSAEDLDEGPAVDGVIGAPEEDPDATPVRGEGFYDSLPTAAPEAPTVDLTPEEQAEIEEVRTEPLTPEQADAELNPDLPEAAPEADPIDRLLEEAADEKIEQIVEASRTPEEAAPWVAPESRPNIAEIAAEATPAVRSRASDYLVGLRGAGLEPEIKMRDGGAVELYVNDHGHQVQIIVSPGANGEGTRVKATYRTDGARASSPLNSRDINRTIDTIGNLVRRAKEREAAKEEPAEPTADAPEAPEAVTVDPAEVAEEVAEVGADAPAVQAAVRRPRGADDKPLSDVELIELASLAGWIQSNDPDGTRGRGFWGTSDKAVDRLVDDGYVARIDSGNAVDDGGRMRYLLTDEGKQALQWLRDNARADDMRRIVRDLDIDSLPTREHEAAVKPSTPSPAARRVLRRLVDGERPGDSDVDRAGLEQLVRNGLVEMDGEDEFAMPKVTDLGRTQQRYLDESDAAYSRPRAEEPAPVTPSQAQDAAETLGDTRTDEILGGALSEASQEDLQRLIAEAEEVGVPAPTPEPRTPRDGEPGRTGDGTEYSEDDLVEALVGRRLTDEERSDQPSAAPDAPESAAAGAEPLPSVDPNRRQVPDGAEPLANADDVRVGDVIYGKRADGTYGLLDVESATDDGQHFTLTGADPATGERTTVRWPVANGGHRIRKADDGAAKAYDAPVADTDQAGPVAAADLRPGDVFDGKLDGHSRRVRAVGSPRKSGFMHEIEVEAVTGPDAGKRGWVKVPSARPVMVSERGDRDGRNAPAASTTTPDAPEQAEEDSDERDRDERDAPEAADAGDGGRDGDGPDVPEGDLPDGDDEDDEQRERRERERDSGMPLPDRDNDRGGRDGSGLPGGPGLPRVPGDDDDSDRDAPAAGAPQGTAVTGNPPVKLDSEKFPPTQEQQDLYDTVLAGNDTLMQAGAGTGKTTTLEGLARRIAEAFPGKKIGYAAFNKSVQLEADGRMPSNTESRTGHSLSWAWAPSWMKNRYGARGALRRPEAVARHLGITTSLPTGGQGAALKPDEVAAAAVRTVDTFANSADDAIGRQHLPQRMRELPGDRQDAIVRLANKAWDDLRAENGRLRLTQDHMRKMWALTRPDFSKSGQGFRSPIDVLFVDEAQDTPPVLAKLYDDQTVQKVIVGDADQAIYGFTGAVDYLSTAKADAELPLTQSWRYGPHIAAMGNRFLTLLGSKKRWDPLESTCRHASLSIL